VQATQKAISVPVLASPIPKWTGVVRIPGRLSAAVVRAVIGPNGGTPRGYRREGFPEHELYQVLSGRKDRFDSL
jgi:hypothetical protein